MYEYSNRSDRSITIDVYIYIYRQRAITIMVVRLICIRTTANLFISIHQPAKSPRVIAFLHDRHPLLLNNTLA